MEKATTSHQNTLSGNKHQPDGLNIHPGITVDQNTEAISPSGLNEADMISYDFIPFGFFELDREGRILSLNHAGAEMLGIDRLKLIKTFIRQYIAPVSISLFDKFFKLTFETGTRQNCNAEILVNGMISIFTHFNGLAGENSQKCYLTAIDITERKLIEHQILDNSENLELKVELRTQQLELANEKLLKEIEEHKKTEIELIKARIEAEKANRAKSDFMAGISHEIRTPMNAILGYADLLIMKSDDPAQKNYLESIKMSGRTLINLINDILYLSKIDAGRMQLELNYIDTAAFFRQFEKIFEFKLTEKKLRYSTNLSGNLPAKFCADAALLRQIILNLAGNAINFTDTGEVELNVRAENNIFLSDKTEDNIKADLVIEVKDTGIGIREEWQNDIFEPFLRIRSKSSQNGLGLGLSIAQRLLRLMNGTLTLKSAEGAGSTFTASIPGILYYGKAADIFINNNTSKADIPFMKATVLLIESSSEVRKAISEALVGTEVTVLEAINLTEGMHLIRNIIPALIISDLKIAETNSYELLAGLHSDKRLKDIPVLALIEQDSVDNHEKNRLKAFAGFVKKPIRIPELCSALLKILPYRTRIEPQNLTAPEDLQTQINIINLKDLITSLEGEYNETWKSFINRQPLGEIKNFAKKLNCLGNNHNSSSITEYGKQLEAATQTFDIEKILQLLKKYPGLVESLKN